MKSIAVLLTLAVALSGCAFQLGALSFAVGDSEASRCPGGSEVDSEGAYICEEGGSIARGSTISEGVTAIFQGVVDLARGLVAGLGAGLAAVGAEDESEVES